MASPRPFADARVAAHFGTYPAAVRKRLLALRELIFTTAARTPEVGTLQETLKWGEPTYATVESKSGTPVRIDWKPKRADAYALFFNCQTGLVETFRTTLADDFEFEGNRGLWLGVATPMPKDAVRFCVEAALTYHLRRREAARSQRRGKTTASKA